MTNERDRRIIARSYRRKERIVIITRVSVYHAYVIGYRGKGVTVAMERGGPAYAAFTYSTIQYAGEATVPADTLGVWARWQHTGEHRVENLALRVPGLAREGFYGPDHRMTG